MLHLGVLEFLDQAKLSGKIINAGFSFHGNLDTFREIVDAYDWEFCQIQYNFLDEMNQAGTEGLKYAASKRLAVMVMEPLRGGSLAGQVPAQGRADLERSTCPADSGGMGAQVCLGPSGGDGCPFGNEPGCPISRRT